MSKLASYFREKHVLVTGGSSGIGLAAAKQLVAAGATVTLCARRREPLDAAVAALGPGATALALDVANEPDVVSVLGPYLEAHPLDALINNAGVVMPGRFTELESRHFREMMDINYFGAVHLCRAAIPAMRARGGGHICNVSSMAGVIGIYGYTAYSASKFAICGFSQCLRAELWPLGIRVSVCLPPDTDTPQLAFENQYKPKETKAIAGTVKTMSADAVAEAMLAGMAAGTYEIVPGFDAWSTAVAARMLPGVTRWVCDQQQKKAATMA
jgi:3-dehydrosphinganine reductase